MARLPFVTLEEASPPVREALEALDVPLNIFRMMAHAETCFRPLLRLGSSILGRQKLHARIRELAILQVAKLTPGEYEWVQHVPIAEQTGITDAQIEALARGDLDANCFDETDKLVLRFGAETLREAKVSDECFAEMRERFSAREIVELILTLGYYSMLARLTEVTETDLDAPAGAKLMDAVSGGRRT